MQHHHNNRTPANLRQLEGNPGKRPIPKTIKPPKVMPEPPSHLDAYAMEEWNRLVAGLFALGVLTSIDQAAFAAYCDTYSQWRHVTEELNKLKKRGGTAALMMITTNGNWIQNPLIGIASNAKRDMMKFAAEFGLTPVARSRISSGAEGPEDGEFEGLIGGKAQNQR